MSEIQGFLIDLDGVMYTGNRAIPGAADAIRFLRKNGYRFRFVSNTTRKCRRTLSARLAGMGIGISEAEIFTPAVAALAYLKQKAVTEARILVAGDVIEDFPQELSSKPLRKPEMVIIGDAGDQITYASLNRAFRDLMGGAELVALEQDRYWMDQDGLSLSAGPFVSALEFASGKTATLMGKPAQPFFAMALRDMGIRPDEAVMIGDDIRTDVRGSQDAGMRGVLVRTGKFHETALRESGIVPDRVIPSIADLKTVIDLPGDNNEEQTL